MWFQRGEPPNGPRREKAREYPEGGQKTGENGDCGDVPEEFIRPWRCQNRPDNEECGEKDGRHRDGRSRAAPRDALELLQWVRGLGRHAENHPLKLASRYGTEID